MIDLRYQNATIMASFDPARSSTAIAKQTFAMNSFDTVRRTNTLPIISRTQFANAVGFCLDSRWMTMRVLRFGPALVARSNMPLATATSFWRRRNWRNVPVLVAERRLRSPLGCHYTKIVKMFAGFTSVAAVRSAGSRRFMAIGRTSSMSIKSYSSGYSCNAELSDAPKSPVGRYF